MRRRDVILALAGTALAGGAVTLLLRRPAALHRLACGEATVTLHADDFAVDGVAMRRVGRAVLAAEGSPSADEIVARLFDAESWADACRGSAAAVLRRRVDADLANGRTVSLRGWVLSRTEADLCAVVARTDP
jgi:hypothetical protein